MTIINKITIPFNKTSLLGKEIEYINEAVLGGQIAGDNRFTKECQSILEVELGVKKALLTTSCTHALEMSAMLLDLRPGDEVIIPSFTFVSTANAFALRGAKPVFADIRSDTLNIDESLLPALINSKTKAIVPVHYGGVGCDMDSILSISDDHGIAVIEDNAHGLFGTYKDRPLGTFGTMATQSFHETKNFTCGEGGALLLDDERYFERAEIIREKGTDRSKFFRGEVDKYSWVDLGSSHLPSDVLAAFLFAQLEMKDEIQKGRKKIWDSYFEELSDWARRNTVTLPFIPDECQQTYHMFYMLMPSSNSRDSLISHLKNKGILSVFHYQPLHLSKMGRSFGGKKSECPVAEDISERIVRLPFYNDLTIADQRVVIDAVTEFRT